MKSLIVVCFSLFLVGQAFGFVADLQENSTFNGEARAAQIAAYTK